MQIKQKWLDPLRRSAVSRLYGLHRLLQDNNGPFQLIVDGLIHFLGPVALIPH
ncbi:MAG: hypothetical protein ABF243_07150 [Celeribacter marinus]